MSVCRICATALPAPDYLAPAPAMTSLSTWIDVPTEVSVCRTCSHAQSPDLPDVQAFYDHEYRISLQSEDHDQMYEMQTTGPVFHTAHQAALMAALDVPQGARLLDFGAAKAATTRHFLTLRPDVLPHVFDVSEDYRPHWASWVPEDAQATYALPERWLDRFDLITAHFVLEHVTDPVSVLSTLGQCLSPEGRLFFTVPDPVGNPGDLLVADHLNHFLPSSLHRALSLAGLDVISLRQDLFRGAHAVVARRHAPGDAAAEQVDPAPVLALLEGWRRCLDGLRAQLDQPDMAEKRVAIYGAGFYGALFAPMVGARVACFLDRNPHLQGGTLEGHPILAPEACPPVDLVIAALNPAQARVILPEKAAWLPPGSKVIYPAGA